MSKNVQIPIEAFFALCDYFEGKEDAEAVEYIKSVLTVKKKAIENHTMYSLSKNKKLAPETREHFRQEYLESKGVSKSFRFDVNYDDENN